MTPNASIVYKKRAAKAPAPMSAPAAFKLLPAPLKGATAVEEALGALVVY